MTQTSHSDPHKECFKCHETLPLSAFYAHAQMADGHVNKCKDCNKRDVQDNYRANKDHYKQYERSRLHAPHRISMRKEHDRRVRAEDPERLRGYKKKWITRNGYKREAQLAVGQAIKQGKIQRQPCERCGSLRAQGHHEDYSKPLEVMWLCPAHHGERHRELRDQGVQL